MMKIFTKMLLAFALLAVCFTGNSTNRAFGAINKSTYIPKNPAATLVDVSAWADKSGSRLVSNSFSTFDWTNFHKGLSKTLAMPKRFAYSFTANASKSSMLGASMINTTMSWDEGKMKPTLNAYPNPSKGVITISLAQASDAAYKITVSNTIGQVIRTIKVPESAHNSDIKLDLSSYPAGVYFYSLLVNDKMVETKRLILQQ